MGWEVLWRPYLGWLIAGADPQIPYVTVLTCSVPAHKVSYFGLPGRLPSLSPYPLYYIPARAR